MEESGKKGTLEHYFSTEEGTGSSFFDHLSEDGGRTGEGVSEGVEPAVCKIFAEEKTETTSFFDQIGAVEPETEWSQAVSSVGNEGGFPSSLRGFEEECDGVWSSETERTRESWIPCDRTRRALIQAATSLAGAPNLDQDLLTRPAVVLEDPLADNVAQLLRHHFGEAEAATRKVLTVDDVSKDERGLRQLIQGECLRAAINLTGSLLSLYGPPVPSSTSSNQRLVSKPDPQHPPKHTRHTPHSVELWFTRLALLVKIGSYQIAEAEAGPWGDLDRPDLYFQFYPDVYGGKPGSMVPFQMRLLVATLPSYLKRHAVALDRLYAVLSVVRKIRKNLKEGRSEDGSLVELTGRQRELAQKVWWSRECRTLHSIVNVALSAKEFPLAVRLVKDLMEDVPPQATNQLRSLESALGRIYLQVGNVTRAEACFNRSKQLRSSDSLDVRDLVDKALLEVSRGCIKEAYETLSRAQALDPSDNCITNNMAACLLYEGRLREAIALLEKAVETRPSTALAEPLLVNLATLHELDSSAAEFHKRNLLRLVAQHRGDSFNVAALKLQR